MENIKITGIYMPDLDNSIKFQSEIRFWYFNYDCDMPIMPVKGMFIDLYSYKPDELMAEYDCIDFGFAEITKVIISPAGISIECIAKDMIENIKNKKDVVI